MPLHTNILSSSTPNWLNLECWHYDSFFDPLNRANQHPVIAEIESYIDEIKLNSHPFFELAKKSRQVLTLWVSQELVMTNAFSQIVLYAASKFNNVHARSVLAEVAYGEHGRLRQGIAKAAHPWLLEQLRISIDLPRENIKPEFPTREFISRLTHDLSDPLTAIAFIGVGNERLIVPEYEAIQQCFRSLLPDANFEPFLQANLIEDITHSRLCYELAAMLIENQDDANRFKAAAIASVDSRVEYFDDLLVLATEIMEK